MIGIRSALAAVLAVAAFGVAPRSAADPDTAALAELAQLPIADAAPKAGYSREQFGPPWTDHNDDEFGENGCDTRDDILARDLTDTVRAGRCTVVSGTLADPYTGATIKFQRGQLTSGRIQIDHLVALGDAWVTGAQALSLRERINLANDPRNLLAVDGPANEAKHDLDAAGWLPPNTAFRCTYVADQITVKATYHLWVTPAEHDAMAAVLSDC